MSNSTTILSSTSWSAFMSPSSDTQIIFGLAVTPELLNCAEQFTSVSESEMISSLCESSRFLISNGFFLRNFDTELTEILRNHPSRLGLFNREIGMCDVTSRSYRRGA